MGQEPTWTTKEEWKQQKEGKKERLEPRRLKVVATDGYDYTNDPIVQRLFSASKKLSDGAEFAIRRTEREIWDIVEGRFGAQKAREFLDGQD